MSVILISTVAIPNDSYVNLIKSIGTKSGFDINSFKVDDTSGSSVFLIDVHCTFDESAKMQEQGGVIIYRRLLKLFEGKQDRLKVIFYSPISKDDLIKLKPENYILTLLPFVQLKFDGQFAKELETIINDMTNKVDSRLENKQDFSNGWRQFNNASENLLSGWALKGLEPIRTKFKKILFVDDQQSEWKSAFSIIFSDTQIFYIKNNRGGEINSQKEFRDNLDESWDSFVDLVKTEVDKKPDLILSDFYLKENHEINKWKDIAEIKSKSGYQLFKVLRNYTPATPYVFHTSSNKAAIYKFLDANGVDDWIIKDTRPDSYSEEKRDAFEGFKECLELVLCNGTYSELYRIWLDIEVISKSQKATFWWSNKYYNIKETIVTILKDCWFGMRRVSNKEVFFEQSLYPTSHVNNDTFTAAAVVNSIGKILELLEFDDIRKGDPGHCGLAQILNSIRNIASHGRKDLYCLNIQDAIFCSKLVLELLKINGNRNDLLTRYPKPTYTLYPFGGKESFKYALFWLYIQLYNSNYLGKHLGTDKPMIEQRIADLFNIAKADTGFKNILNKEFPKIKQIIAGVTTSQLRVNSGRYTIISGT